MSKLKSRWVEEEVTIADFCERLVGINDFTTPEEYDVSGYEISILGYDKRNKKDVYKKIKKFIVKPVTNEYYTDGKLKGTSHHRIIEDGKEILLKDHPNFKIVKDKMPVVDFEIQSTHNYYANGRLNHNTVPGGKAMGYAASVRVRLSSTGQIKKGDTIIGNECKAVVVKNRMGPPKKVAEFEIHFDSGIQDLKSWIDFMKENELITGTSAGWTFKVPSGTIKLSTKEFVEKINSDAAFKDEVYTLLCDHQIMKYRDPNSKIDEEVTVDENVKDED